MNYSVYIYIYIYNCVNCDGEVFADKVESQSWL